MEKKTFSPTGKSCSSVSLNSLPALPAPPAATPALPHSKLLRHRSASEERLSKRRRGGEGLVDGPGGGGGGGGGGGQCPVCPRCLGSCAWLDTCWVAWSGVRCGQCGSPGHLETVHLTNNFRHRKILIQTFGWLPFKHWFEVK